ncbi:MAG: methionine--tRNA ligase [Microgenomates group bacterium]|nr:methionine--tRNA ligase [Microgenomates group bacterium]
MVKNFYITTTLPYINDSPHLGFAMEIVRADAVARFYRLLGYHVFFNTGTDEHGLKIYQSALAKKKDPQKFCDEQSKKFKALKTILNLSFNRFIRTTDKEHIRAAQEFWQRCFKKGDIYKAKYKIKYCVGCELEKTESELVNDYCPLHPNKKIEIIEEENYFFRFSKYQKALLNLYETNKLFIIPDFRLKELKSFVAQGLKDFSISRLREKLPWGIPVPNDESQVMYVWFDALINYISTLGWPEDQKKFNQFWPGIQIAGKDNLRQQGAMWQAMLLSAGLPTSKKIFVEGFITFEGKKMSKSLGNFIDPFSLVKKFGTDPVRYYLLREIPPFNDGDFSEKRMKEIYTAELANELGNLIMRITKLAQIDNLFLNQSPKIKISDEIIDLIKYFQFNLILEFIWKKIKKLNQKIDTFSPWKKKPVERRNFLLKSLEEINQIAKELLPFLPTTAQIIIDSSQGKIKKIEPLFPKLK